MFAILDLAVFLLSDACMHPTHMASHLSSEAASPAANRASAFMPTLLIALIQAIGGACSSSGTSPTPGPETTDAASAPSDVGGMVSPGDPDAATNDATSPLCGTPHGLSGPQLIVYDPLLAGGLYDGPAVVERSTVDEMVLDFVPDDSTVPLQMVRVQTGSIGVIEIDEKPYNASVSGIGAGVNIAIYPG